MVVARSRAALLKARQARMNLRRRVVRQGPTPPTMRRSPRITLEAAAKRRLARRMRARSAAAALPLRGSTRPRPPRPDLMNMDTMPPCGSRSSLGTRGGLLTRGTLSYSVIPKRQRITRQVLARQVVCASEITMSGRLKVLPMRNGSFVLEVVSVKPFQVRKGDVLLIQRGRSRTRGVISEMLGPFGNWDVRWNDSRLIITPVWN